MKGGEKKPSGVIVVDPEMKAMNMIVKALMSLPDDQSRERVLVWLQSKWSFPLVDRRES